MRAAPLPRPVEAGGETVEFTLASLTYDLLRSWTGIRPPWGKMTGVRPVRLIHDKRAAGWTEADIDRFFLERFDCSRAEVRHGQGHRRPAGAHPEAGQRAQDVQPVSSASRSAPPGAATAALSAATSTGTASWCSPMWTACADEVEDDPRSRPTRPGLKLCSIYIGGGTPTSLFG